MTNETAHQKLAGLLLDRPLEQFVTEQRTNGATWRQVAERLAVATDQQVVVSHETLRLWFGPDQTGDAA